MHGNDCFDSTVAILIYEILASKVTGLLLLNYMWGKPKSVGEVLMQCVQNQLTCFYLIYVRFIAWHLFPYPSSAQFLRLFRNSV